MRRAQLDPLTDAVNLMQANALTVRRKSKGADGGYFLPLGRFRTTDEALQCCITIR